MREEGERIMRKRDEAKNRREIIHALSMIMQIGLSMMVCMSVSLLIGYGLDKLFGTRCFMVIMMFIGILASLRSMLVLTGQYHPGSTKKETQEGKMETAKISLWEVIIGIWILAIVVILGGIFFVPEPLPYALGEIAGSITASGLMVHLYRSIDIELDLPEKKAVSHSRAMGLVRSAIEIGVLVGSFFLSKWVMPYTVLAGLLARKAAALMVPWMEKIRLRKKKLL